MTVSTRRDRGLVITEKPAVRTTLTAATQACLGLPCPKAVQRKLLAGILTQDAAAQKSELIGIDFLNRTAAAAWREGEDVIEIRPTRQRILEAYGFTRRSKVNQRPHPGIAAVGSRACQAEQALSVGLIAEKQVTVLDLFPEVAEAGGASDPAFIAHGIRPAAARAEVLVKFPSSPCVDLEDPDLHR
jgi:hypothetical protein